MNGTARNEYKRARRDAWNRDERNQRRIKLFARQTWLNIPSPSPPSLLLFSLLPLPPLSFSLIHNATHQANARSISHVPRAHGELLLCRLITLQISYLNQTPSHTHTHARAHTVAILVWQFRGSTDPLPNERRTAIMFVRSM